MVGPDWDWWLPGILDQVCYLLRWVVYLSWTKRKGKRKYQLYLYVSPCKVIWNPESGKFFLVEFRIREILACRIQNPGNLCFWNSESGKFLLVESRIQEIVAWGIQIPGNFCLWNPQSQETFACGILNPESSALRSVVQLRNPKSANDWNPEYNFCWQGIWNSVPGIGNRQCGIQNSRLYWITWHGASYDIAHGLKHIISNCNQFLFCF